MRISMCKEALVKYALAPVQDSKNAPNSPLKVTKVSHQLLASGWDKTQAVGHEC